MPANHAKSIQAVPRSTKRLDALFAVGVVAICALVVTAMAWTRPTTKPAHIDYQQSGSLTYSASTSAASVYGGANVATRQPVYTNAVQKLDVAYAYSLRSSAPSKIRGNEQLVANIDNGQGVLRSFALQPPTAFSGDHFAVSGTLNLSDLQSAASAFEQMATADGAAGYVVSIVPNVVVQGRTGGAALHAAFDQPVQFNYRPSSTTVVGVLTPIHPPGGQSAASSNGLQRTAASAASSAAMTVSAQGAVLRPGGSLAKLVGLPVGTARIAAPCLLVGALLILILLGRGLLRDLTTGDERQRISARHGASMVEVAALPAAPLSTVELSSFEGVLKVARRLGCPVLFHDDVRSVYAVVDGATVYRYVADYGELTLPFDPEPLAREVNGHLVEQRS